MEIVGTTDEVLTHVEQRTAHLCFLWEGGASAGADFDPFKIF